MIFKICIAIDCRIVFNRYDDGSVSSVTIHSILKLDKRAPVVAPKVG